MFYGEALNSVDRWRFGGSSFFLFLFARDGGDSLSDDRVKEEERGGGSLSSPPSLFLPFSLSPLGVCSLPSSSCIAVPPSPLLPSFFYPPTFLPPPEIPSSSSLLLRPNSLHSFGKKEGEEGGKRGRISFSCGWMDGSCWCQIQPPNWEQERAKVENKTFSSFCFNSGDVFQKGEFTHFFETKRVKFFLGTANGDGGRTKIDQRKGVRKLFFASNSGFRRRSCLGLKCWMQASKDFFK